MTPVSPGAPPGAAKHTCNHLHTIGGMSGTKNICTRCSQKKWPLMRRPSARKSAEQRRSHHGEVTVLAVGRWAGVCECVSEAGTKRIVFFLPSRLKQCICHRGILNISKHTLAIKHLLWVFVTKKKPRLITQDHTVLHFDTEPVTRKIHRWMFLGEAWENRHCRVQTVLLFRGKFQRWTSVVRQQFLLKSPMNRRRFSGRLRLTATERPNS